MMLVEAFNWRSVFKNTMSITGGGGGGGKLLPIQSLKWNPNDVLTTCKAISKGLARGLCTDHAHYVKIHRSTVLRRKKKKTCGRRRDCFSLLYFGNSQIY